jgi:hypothetical protein
VIRGDVDIDLILIDKIYLIYILSYFASLSWVHATRGFDIRQFKCHKEHRATTPPPITATIWRQTFLDPESGNLPHGPGVLCEVHRSTLPITPANETLWRHLPGPLSRTYDDFPLARGAPFAKALQLVTSSKTLIPLTFSAIETI